MAARGKYGKAGTKPPVGIRRFPRTVILTLLFLPGAAFVGTAPAEAEYTQVMPGAGLPTGRLETSAIWDGSNAYIFGGHGAGSTLSEIVRFDPRTETTTVMNARLPYANHGMSSIWDGSHAYLFGGAEGDSTYTHIVRFNPATGAVTTMAATLPAVTSTSAAIWDGRHAYVFGVGGRGIVRYDPSADTVTTMTATLPQQLIWGTGAIWDGSKAYILGTVFDPHILRYDPSTDTLETMTTSLPSGREDTSTVWDGTHAYVIGGNDNQKALSQIVRFTPSTNTVTTVGATLPSGRLGTSAVWTGSQALIFGGIAGTTRLKDIVGFEPGTNSVRLIAGEGLGSARDGASAIWDGSSAFIFGGHSGSSGASYLNEIVRYNPSADKATLMSAVLPSARHGTSAVWDGSSAYVFGGYTGSAFLDQIVRYTPSTNTVTTMGARLPSGRTETAAIWDGTNAYVFGGHGTTDFAQVVRYTPATDTVTIMNATLPVAAYGMSAVWDGSRVHLFGGDNDAGLLGQVLQYDPVSDILEASAATLPSPRRSTSAIWSGNHAYIFGGEDGAYLRQILRFDPAAATIVRMDTSMPRGGTGTSAIWALGSAYIFGGYDGTRVNQVIRYDPFGNPPPPPPSTPTVPGAPTGLTATAASSSAIDLAWAAPSNNGGATITAYRIYRGSSPGPETLIATTSNALTSFRDAQGVNPDTTYHYRVAAMNSAGVGPMGNEASATTLPTSQTPAASAPRQITSLTATAVSSSEVRLSWQTPGGDAPTYYNIYRGTSSHYEVLHATTTTAVTTFADTQNVLSSTTYYYLVEPCNPAGCGGFLLESEAIATTPRSSPQAVPSAPTSVRATATTSSTIELSWVAPSNDGGATITAYKVYRDTLSAPTLLLATTGAVTSFSDVERIQPSTTYYYRVSAVNALGEGPLSTEAMATTLAPPPKPPSEPVGVTATLTQSGSVKVIWSSPPGEGEPIVEYTLYRTTVYAGGGGTLSVVVPDGSTSYVDRDVSAGVTYHYTVSASNAHGEGPRSPRASVTIPVGVPDSPNELHAIATEDGHVQLSWVAPSANGAPIFTFNIFRSTPEGEETLIATTVSGEAYLDSDDLQPGTAYYYAVSAVNAAGEGARSTIATVTIRSTRSESVPPTALGGSTNDAIDAGDAKSTTSEGEEESDLARAEVAEDPPASSSPEISDEQAIPLQAWAVLVAVLCAGMIRRGAARWR